MKKYLVIGNPIDHSLSPLIHNHWISYNNINAIYEKKKLNENELKDSILDIKKKKIDGINVTVPFKKSVISYVDQLSPEAEKTQSVNTIYLDSNKIIGHNTDIDGFKLSVENSTFDLVNKEIFIIGAGGVVSSIILALNKMKVSKIALSNRSKKKAEDLKKQFNNIDVVNWGVVPNFDMIINATSVGLNHNDKLNLDFSNVGKKKFFYDVIYNPRETNFLKLGKEMGNKIENGKMMFIFQAALAFKVWHGIHPIINEKTITLVDQ
jgi:shikimate dehydrogenase